jgi:hypothetical protein
MSSITEEKRTRFLLSPRGENDAEQGAPVQTKKIGEFCRFSERLLLGQPCIHAEGSTNLGFPLLLIPAASHVFATYPTAAEAERPYNNSATSVFSSFNSATDASIFARLKSFIGSPCTISHFPPRMRKGKEEIKPFSTP